MNKAERIRFNMGQQGHMNSSYLDRVKTSIGSGIRCVSHNIKMFPRSLQEREQAEYEIQQLELLLSEIEIAYSAE